MGAALVLSACSRLSSPGGGGPSGGTTGDSTGYGGGSFGESLGSDSTAAGLVSLTPAPDRVRVDWRVHGLEPENVRLALFLSTSVEDLFAGTPLDVEVASGHHVFDGLLPGTTYHVGLGIEDPDDPGAFDGAGPVLSGTTLYPVYANPLADPEGADGKTPETAYPSLFVAVFQAYLGNVGQGGQVWIAEGSFTDVSLPVLEGVHLFGGFDASFDLETRDPVLHPTVLEGLAGSGVLLLEAGAGPQVIDGIEIDGLGASSFGIDLDRTPGRLRRVVVGGCNRGLRLRAPHSADVTRVELLACRVENNALEGLSLEGPYDVEVEACIFQSNGQEGFEFGPWIAPEGEVVELVVRDSRFSGNAHEGLDVDLRPGPTLDGGGGRFHVSIEDSLFERNGTAGLLLDLDYETHPQWSSSLVLRGCETRANGTHGVALDLDAQADVVVHRLLSTANVQDGISVTSESYPGFLTVSHSALVANLGAGLRASLGNYGVALSQSVLAGNGEAGVRVTESSATVVSSVAHLQPQPFGDARVAGSPVLESPWAPFVHAPVEYRRVVGGSGSLLQLDAPLTDTGPGTFELAADGVARLASSIDGSTINLEPVLEQQLVPTSLVKFVGEASVEEDYRPAPGSPIVGAGLQPPAGPSVDAGPHGGPFGAAPGAELFQSREPFRVGTTEPKWGLAIEPGEPFLVHFEGGCPTEESLDRGLRLVDALGVELPLEAQLVDDVLVVAPPTGGWAAGDALELHGTLVARAKDLPLVPILLPIGSVSSP